MDKSLDQLIKENPRKFSLKGNQQRRNNAANKGAVGKATALAAKKADGARVGVKRNLTGRVTKKGVQGGQPTKFLLKKKINQLNTKKTTIVTAGRVVDARNKLLAKNRLKIQDARDKIADITKKSTSDLRQKLLQKRPTTVKKLMSLKTTQNPKLLQRTGNPESPLTRTIISRTVENEFARQQFSSVLPYFNVTPVNTRFQQPPPAHQYYHPYAEPIVNFKHSTAAMDMEPPLPASRRIRPGDKHLGTREEPKRLDVGHRVYVDNLHHKVTQEDIFELFGDIGPLVKATLQRPGMAEVVYSRREDALRAVDVYHNRQLDGLPMHCTLAAVYEGRQENDAPMKIRSQPTGGKSSSVAPDINTIHKALFNKSSSNAQIFTVTLPKKN